MSQIVKVHYPDPSNCESTYLVINTNSRTIRFPVTYERAKEMTAELARMQSTATFIKLHHSKGVLMVDATLAAEIYAACVEIIVDVELGEDLAMLEVKEQAYAYC